MIQTFDVDPRRLPNGFLVFPDVDDVIRRLWRCSYATNVAVRRSASGNGFHVRLECMWDNCDICRLCFDSDFRFMLDMLFRKPRQRNVLWKRKTYEKNGHYLTCDAGEWEEYGLL